MGKLIEVDEEIYNQNARLRERLAKIAANPRNAAALEAMEKELDPKVATPNLDREKAYNEPIEALRKDITELKKGLEDERAKEREEREKVLRDEKWSKGQKWMLDHGYTPEGIEKIEKELMAPKGIVDHQDAAKLWEADHPTPAPATPGGFGAWNFLEPPPEDKSDSNIKALIESRGNNEVVAERMARDALNEFRQQVTQAKR
jgi:hypothetical protein